MDVDVSSNGKVINSKSLWSVQYAHYLSIMAGWWGVQVQQASSSSSRPSGKQGFDPSIHM